MKQYSKSKGRGCPTCGGIDPRSCVRCHGQTPMCDWWDTDIGWSYMPHLRREAPTKKARATDPIAVEGVCCQYCVRFEQPGCPVVRADPWSRWRNWCNFYAPNPGIREAKPLPIT